MPEHVLKCEWSGHVLKCEWSGADWSTHGHMWACEQALAVIAHAQHLLAQAVKHEPMAEQQPMCTWKNTAVRTHGVHTHVCAQQQQQQQQRTFLRQGPQLQHMTQPGPHEPRHAGQIQRPLSAAASASSPWRFLRHLWLQEEGVADGKWEGGAWQMFSTGEGCCTLLIAQVAANSFGPLNKDPQ